MNEIETAILQQPDAARIAEILRPHVVASLPTGGDEWRNIEQMYASKWQKAAFTNRLRRIVAGSLKKVSRVDHDYSGAWRAGPPDATAHLVWGDTAYDAHVLGEKAVHVALFTEIIRSLKPRRVLEVGSGNGAVAIALSRLNPNVAFHGVELTEAGVEAARELQCSDRFAADYGRMIPVGYMLSEPQTPVHFEIGNAKALAHPDNAFDLVYTSLALEQMHAVAHDALREIARVSGGAVVMIEPFRDFNKTEIRRNYVRAKEYLPVELAELSKFGLDVVHRSDDFPSKVTRGAGLVLALSRARA